MLGPGLMGFEMRERKGLAAMWKQFPLDSSGRRVTLCVCGAASATQENARECLARPVYHFIELLSGQWG